MHQTTTPPPRSFKISCLTGQKEKYPPADDGLIPISIGEPNGWVGCTFLFILEELFQNSECFNLQSLVEFFQYRTLLLSFLQQYCRY